MIRRVVDEEQSAPPSQRTLKASEVVAGRIATAIVEQRLETGARLPSERDMIETYGVGRATVREALRLLEGRGVIVIRPGRNGGPVVRRPNAQDLGEALTLMLRFDGFSLRDIIHARAAIEPTLARLAAKNRSATQIRTLRESTSRMMEELEDNAAFLRLNQEFHSAVANAAGNVVLRVFAETLEAIADGARAGVTYDLKHRRAVVRAHLQIVEALEARDPDRAAESMATHIRDAGRYWRKTYFELYEAAVDGAL